MILRRRPRLMSILAQRVGALRNTVSAVAESAANRLQVRKEQAHDERQIFSWALTGVAVLGVAYWYGECGVPARRTVSMRGSRLVLTRTSTRPSREKLHRRNAERVPKG